MGVPAARPPFEDLYREFLPRIYGYVRAQVRVDADAEDITSRVFIKAYEAYGRFDASGSLAAWLFTIARNAALDHHRAGTRRDKLDRRVAAQGEDALDPGEMAEAEMARVRLVACVERLPQKTRSPNVEQSSGFTAKKRRRILNS